MAFPMNTAKRPLGDDMVGALVPAKKTRQELVALSAGDQQKKALIPAVSTLYVYELGVNRAFFYSGSIYSTGSRVRVPATYRCA